nr:immunoglobulin heavy chain junction region [Macaca mulatta]
CAGGRRQLDFDYW